MRSAVIQLTPDDTLRRWSYYGGDRAAASEVLRQEDLRMVAQQAGVENIYFEAI
jgi:hypothetical protein